MIKHKSAKKQNELDQFVKLYSMNQDDLVQLIKKGIRQKGETIPSFQHAFRGGNYLGCPGKDIYFAILNGFDIDVLSIHLSEIFPVVPPTDHVAVAACLRYIYGCFDKQGSLLSEKHEDIVFENDWKISMPFIRNLEKCFDKCDNNYGLLLSHEMMGHRYGDDAVVHEDKSAIDEMLNCYISSQSLAKSSGSLKHMFTPFYWAAMYLDKLDDDLAKTYFLKTLKEMESHCPDSREGYKSKAMHSAKYILSHSSGKEKDQFKRWLMKCSNVCLKSIKKVAK